MIEKLEYLLALAREQHFGRAADACGVTQPTLSAGIKQLEEQLGVLLVSRGSRFQALTPEGQRVLDWARRIVADSRALRSEVRALRTGLSGNLRLAAIPSALFSAALLTTPYRARHPDMRFTVLSRSSHRILALLEDLEVEAGLTYLDQEPLGRVRTVPLYREHYSLVIGATDPLAQRRQVALADIARIPLCLLTPDMQNRRILDRMFRSSGLDVQPTLESNSMLVLLSHIRTGQWASILSTMLATALQLPDTIRVIPIEHPVQPPLVGLVFPHREPLTPMTSALVNEARRLAEATGVR